MKVESAMALPFSLPMPYRFDLKSAMSSKNVDYILPTFALSDPLAHVVVSFREPIV